MCQSQCKIKFSTVNCLHFLFVQEHHMVVSTGSMHVIYVNPSMYMHIDVSSAQALELITPLRASTQRSKSSSLFSWLNHTKTRCGAQLLKVNVSGLCACI
jgi:DNA mismatch repair ATPase MutS